MFIRFVALIVCLASIVACAIVAYDAPGWFNLQLDMQIIIGMIGGVSFLMLTFLTLVSEQKVSREERRQMHHQRFS